VNEHPDHARYEDDLAAYLLDALTADEARAMERHIEVCGRCQERAGWLQASVELLPTAVEQLEPPRELRERLMQTVRAEADALHADERHASEPAEPKRPQERRGWLGRLVAVPRPALALGAMLLVIAGGAVGYAIGNGDGTDATTVQAQVDPSVSGARATLERDGDRGVLRVSGLPQHRDRIYEVWIARGNDVRPAGLFQVDRSGQGAAAIPTGLDAADQVMVSLEPPTGSPQPTSDPLVIAEI
jgi:anti-sigma-K factor RskA